MEIYINILDEPTEKHHISGNVLVAIPKDLHQLYNGKGHEYHIFMIQQIVKQLYNKENILEDMDKLLDICLNTNITL